MEAADDRCDLRLARQLLRVADGVDDPGVTAPAQDDEPTVAEAEDERLVTEVQRVGLPASRVL